MGLLQLVNLLLVGPLGCLQGLRRQVASLRQSAGIVPELRHLRGMCHSSRLGCRLQHRLRLRPHIAQRGQRRFVGLEGLGAARLLL